MSFLALAKERYSVRKFKKDAIEGDQLKAILEAGLAAPTACNNQPQRIYVIKDEQVKKKIAEDCRYTFDAPVILVIGYDKERSWKNPLMNGLDSGETDAAIVCTHMMLAAWELGIGSCWVGYFNTDTVKQVLSLPESVCVTAMLPIGYPAEDAKPAARHFVCRAWEDTITEM